MTADLTRIPMGQRRTILGNYVTDLAAANRIPETGQEIASELIDRLRAGIWRKTLGIRILKPKGEGETKYMPIDQASVSGGEALTAAMMIYLVVARLRADWMHGTADDAGILMLDNPLGKAPTRHCF